METKWGPRDTEPATTRPIAEDEATTLEGLADGNRRGGTGDPEIVSTIRDWDAASTGGADTVADDRDRTVEYAAGGIDPDVETLPDDGRATWPIGRDPSRSGSPANGWSPGERVPGYEILEELGRGGMGVVYKARQLQLNRLVALKRIRDDRHVHPEHRARFRIEAEAVARLHHPNILQIYQIGEADGLPFVALELLEGGSLADRLAGTPRPPREAAALVATLARALHAAHLAGIIHRDLKPSNVLFDREGIPKVADFGLAKRLDIDDNEAGQTHLGQVIGTPSYMAPEQAAGKVREVGPAADLYALGGILYELLTGRPPFKGTTSEETLHLVLTEDPVPPSRLRPKVPFDLETICLKCLARDPRRRYADAKALAEDLDRYLAGEPILARRTPPWERAAKWARRRPTTTCLLALVLVASLAAAVVARRAELSARLAARREEDRLARLRKDVDQALFEAQAALAQRGWDEVRVIVSRQSSRLESEPRLADLRAKAGALLDRARRGQADERAVERARARLGRFLEARDEALFLDTRFAGIGSPEATCRAARAALGEFGEAGADDAWTLPPLPEALSPRERDEVAGGCYQLLLVLADAVSELPGAESSARADQALRILDRAAALRPSATRAYHLRRAACLEKKGDSRGAALGRAEADRKAPADAFDFFLSGRERSRRSDWAAAIRDFNAALQRQPDHFWAHCLLAIGSIQTQQPLNARPALNACLKSKPGSAWLYLLRGIANAEAGNFALGLARRYPDQSGSFAEEAAGQFEAAEADYRKALGLLGDRPEPGEIRYALLVNRGLIRLERRDLEAAAADLREAIRLDGRHHQAYSALGLVEQRRGRAAEAFEQFDKAIRLRPDWAPLYRGRADIALGLERPTPARREAALRDLEEAIRLEPPGSPAIASDRTKQAGLLYRAGRVEEALAACDAALKVAPQLAEAHRLRLQALLDLRRYDDLIRSCDAVLAASRASADLFELRGMARDALEDFPAAIADYTQALALRAEDPRLRIRRGWSYLLDDAPRPALRDFDEALRLAPADPDALSGRGFARALLGRHRDAVIDAEESLRRGGTNWRVAYNAARVYAQASASAAVEASKAGPDAVLLVSKYHDRAVALIRLALERLPGARRAAVYRETILDDPVLRPIRRRLRAPAIALPDEPTSR